MSDKVILSIAAGLELTLVLVSMGLGAWRLRQETLFQGAQEKRTARWIDYRLYEDKVYRAAIVNGLLGFVLYWTSFFV